MADGVTGGLLGDLPQEDRDRLLASTFGQIGGLLMAAGQKQMPAQRAQYLAQLGNVGQNIESSVFRAQQARLMGAQMQDKMRELEELRTISQVQKDNPEMLAKQLGQDIETIKMASPRALADAARQRVIQTPEQRELAKVQLETARNQLATGRLVTVGNEVFRFDPQTGGLARLTPQRELGIGEQAATTGGGAGEGQKQEMYPAATINRGLDYSRAFGLKGAVNYYTGKVQGVLGGESKETAEAGKAISEVNTLRNSLISATAAEVAGKNLKSTQQRIADLLPEGGALFTSPQDAVNKFSSVRSLVDSDMKDLEYIASDRSPASPADKVKAAQAWRDLKRNRDNISVVIDNLAGGGRAENTAAPSQTVKPQPQTVVEGTVIFNKQTGARKVLRNGRWEDM